jgi:hypothetical protein
MSVTWQDGGERSQNQIVSNGGGVAIRSIFRKRRFDPSANFSSRNGVEHGVPACRGSGASPSDIQPSG